MSSYRLLLFDARWNGAHQDVADLPNGLIAEQIDVDAHPDLARSFQVRNVPTLILLRDGVERWRQVGRHPVSELHRRLFMLTASELIDPAWLTRQDGLIPKLAKGIAQENRAAELPILADALEEAGCTNADILNYCRQPGEHVRGCWVLDLILGKD
jgi:thioredoxin-like negative regulator of GroEL